MKESFCALTLPMLGTESAGRAKLNTPESIVVSLVCPDAPQAETAEGTAEVQAGDPRESHQERYGCMRTKIRYDGR